MLGARGPTGSTFTPCAWKAASNSEPEKEPEKVLGTVSHNLHNSAVQVMKQFLTTFPDSSTNRGFVTQFGKTVSWRSQVATHLRYLANFGNCVTKPTNR